MSDIHPDWDDYLKSIARGGVDKMAKRGGFAKKRRVMLPKDDPANDLPDDVPTSTPPPGKQVNNPKTIRRGAMNAASIDAASAVSGAPKAGIHPKVRNAQDSVDLGAAMGREAVDAAPDRKKYVPDPGWEERQAKMHEAHTSAKKAINMTPSHARQQQVDGMMDRNETFAYLHPGENGEPDALATERTIMKRYHPDVLRQINDDQSSGNASVTNAVDHAPPGGMRQRSDSMSRAMDDARQAIEDARRKRRDDSDMGSDTV